MSELMVYGTEGAAEYPKDSTANDAISKNTSEMTSVPPWPIAYLDTGTARLYQRFISYKRSDEATSQRPNNYFVVVDSSNTAAEDLETYADTFASLLETSFERSEPYDDDFVDPMVIEDAWRQCQPNTIVPQTAAAKLVDQNDQQIWKVPDLASGYMLIAEYVLLDSPTSAVLVDDANSDWSADVVIEIGNSAEIEPTEQTEKLLAKEVSKTYKESLEELVDNLTKEIEKTVIPTKEPPVETLLAWIVFTGITLNNIQNTSVLSKIIQKDSGVFVGDIQEYNYEYQQFKGVNQDDITKMWEDAFEIISSEAEQQVTVASGIDTKPEEIVDLDRFEAALTRRYRRYHLEAVEEYMERVTWATDDEWFEIQKNIKQLRDKWLKQLEDPGWQISAWPGIRSLTGAKPVAKTDPVIESLNTRLTNMQDEMMVDRLEELDNQVETFFNGCSDQFELDRTQIKRRYLSVSNLFANRDFIIVMLPNYKWIVLLLILLIASSAGAGYLLVV